MKISVAILTDRKVGNGGVFSSDIWRTRDLNTTISDIDDIVSLFSDDFTLGPGTYEIEAIVPGYRVDKHQARIYNVSDSSVLKRGVPVTSANVCSVDGCSIVRTVVALTSSKTFRIEHICTSSRSNGFGVDSNWGTSQFTTVTIKRIKEA
jgi:hypothetical protein